MIVDYVTLASPQSRENNNKWDDDPDPIWLLTPTEFDALPDGTPLTCINGKVMVKGVDDFDDDIRFGVLAYGLRETQFR